MKYKFSCLITVSLVSIVSCQKDVISIDTTRSRPRTDLTYVKDYFNLIEGAFWTYKHTYISKSGTQQLGFDVWRVAEDSIKIGAFTSAVKLQFLPDSNVNSLNIKDSYFEINENDGLLRILDPIYKFGYPLIDLSQLSKYNRFALTTVGVPSTKGYFYNMYNPVIAFNSKFGNIETISCSIDSLGQSNTLNEYTYKKIFYYFSKGIGPVKIQELTVNKELFISKPDSVSHIWEIIRYGK